jgi:hypothetical protein
VTFALKAPRALIFDMDGVLVDSEPLHKRAKEMAFQEAGIHFPESTYESYKGRPDRTMFHEVLADKSVDEIAELLHRKHQFFEKIEHELQPIPRRGGFCEMGSGALPAGPGNFGDSSQPCGGAAAPGNCGLLRVGGRHRAIPAS